jgi:hypothetical protein
MFLRDEPLEPDHVARNSPLLEWYGETVDDSRVHARVLKLPPRAALGSVRRPS